MTTSASARRSRSIGVAGEVIALNVLLRHGVICHQLQTGMAVKWSGGKPVRAHAQAPVLADIVGCIPPAGRALVCEVKRRDDCDALPFSVLQEHQRANLSAWSDAGALSLVAWVRGGSECILIPWREATNVTDPKWGHRRSLPIAIARALHHIAVTELTSA